MDTERRLEDLEVKVAYLESLVMDLDALLRQVADRNADLDRELTAIREQVLPGDVTAAAVEKPPHY